VGLGLTEIVAPRKVAGGPYESSIW